jgi:hypothetical protein
MRGKILAERRIRLLRASVLLGMQIRLVRVFQRFSRKLVRALMVLLFVSCGSHAVGMGGFEVQFSGSLMIFVVRSVVIAGGHSEFPYLIGLIVRFFRQFIGTIGILQRSLVVPVAGGILALFVVFRRGAVGFCRKFVLFRGLSV